MTIKSPLTEKGPKLIFVFKMPSDWHCEPLNPPIFSKFFSNVPCLINLSLTHEQLAPLSNSTFMGSP